MPFPLLDLIRVELGPIPMFMWQYAAVLGLLALILVLTRHMRISPAQSGLMYSAVLGLSGYAISALLHVYLPPPSSAPIRYDLLFLAGMMGGWRGGALAYLLIFSARLQWAGTVQATYTGIDMAIVTLGGVLCHRWFIRQDLADLSVRKLLLMWGARSLTLVVSGLVLLGLHFLPPGSLFFELLPYKNSLGSLVRKTLMAGPALLFFASVFAMFKLDATDRRRQHRDWRSTRTDSLTRLPNRRALREYLDLNFNHPTPQDLALISIGMANHAQMILSHGHDWSDRFLRQLARLAREEPLRTLLQPYQARAFHFTDLSLVLVLNGVTSQQLEQMGLPSALFQELNLKAQDSASGAAPLLTMAVARCDPRAHADAASALRDLSLQLHTQSGETRMVSYLHTSFAQKARREVDVLAHLSEWVDTNTPPLAYMPKCDLQTGQVLGAEGLLRLRDAHGILVPPGQVLALAAKHKLLAAFEWSTIERACSDYQRWARFGRACPLSVNISSVSLVSADFAVRLLRLLDKAGLPHGAIVLELTEHDQVPDVDTVRENARLLNERGIKLSLDDFGSGYSGLSVLARFPFSELKIDHGMVALIDKPRMNSAIQLALESAQRYGATFVAEGVETQTQLSALRRLGIQQGQGYLFSRELSLDDLMRFTTHHNSPSPTANHPAATPRVTRQQGLPVF